ncbi:hypothetical protein PoB_002007400 [Plakobranchus ocellatus]|uniref:Uncharacterized protein n=1 Tax=Plakobranchus ocellatus TaxID=259542 RepID=A0AAV3ZDX0_9GAST|nr:hypothetical protein PoB_002007400 [Plakobranchus ocellatus]
MADRLILNKVRCPHRPCSNINSRRSSLRNDMVCPKIFQLPVEHGSEPWDRALPEMTDQMLLHASTVSVGPHWRQQFTCPTIHVLKYFLSLVRAHTKSATCRSVGAILCVSQPSLTSVALSDKEKGGAIT